MDLNQDLQPRKQVKASAILYCVSVISGFLGLEIILLDVLMRKPNTMPDSFLEQLELNPYSQIGIEGIVIAMGLFWLGLVTDRRGG